MLQSLLIVKFKQSLACQDIPACEIKLMDACSSRQRFFIINILFSVHFKIEVFYLNLNKSRQ